MAILVGVKQKAYEIIANIYHKYKGTYFVALLERTNFGKKMKNFVYEHIASSISISVMEKVPFSRKMEDKSPSLIKLQYNENMDKYFNILLIQLPFPANRRHKRIIPMGLAYLASSLIKKVEGVNVGVLDAQVYSLGYDEIMAEIISKKWELIGITYWTVQSQFAFNISKAIRTYNNNIIIVHGGVHPTLSPEEALEYADYCVLHEGEETFPELVDCIMNDKSIENVKGIAYKRNDKVVYTPPRPFIENIDDIPFPAWHLLPIEKYNMPLHITGGQRLPIIDSRGCPYNCSFCCSPLLWKRKVRWRSGKNIVSEMKEIIDKYGINQFHSWNDNFTLNKEFVEDLCNEIIREGLDIKWVCLDRAEHVNRHSYLLKLMKKAGCVGMEIGVESVNPDTFLYIHKDQAVGETKKAVQNLKEAGLYPLYTCMVFNPGETITGYYVQNQYLNTIQEGFEWFEYFHPFPFPLYIGQFSTPYPGTKFFEEADKQGLVLIEDNVDRYHHQINFIPNSLLDDVSVRVVEHLAEEDVLLFLRAVYTGFWADFPGKSMKRELSNRLYEVYRFIHPFFKKCNGELTVRQIAIQLSDYLNIRFTRSVRLTAYAVYIFAQMGLIRSALYHTEVEIEPKHVTMPAHMSHEILKLLELRGITKDMITQDTSDEEIITYSYI
jgi:radical SAM superfamily enzyme YgiQ (UPF0313 family)